MELLQVSNADTNLTSCDDDDEKHVNFAKKRLLFQHSPSARAAN